MLYLFDEYLKDNPQIVSKNVQGLKKFQDSSKYLHEMTLEELNGEAKKCKATTDGVADKYKRQIRNYLKWLNSKNVQTDPNIVEGINFPIADKQFLIYSTEDIAHYYDLFFKALDKHQERKTIINKGTFLMSWASGILAFHGLTPEQILALNLDDVTADGVKGYDLPLSNRDIDILIQYKDLKVMPNNLLLIGNKYIRSASNGEKDHRFLSTPVWRSHLNDEDNYLKGLLRISNLYQLGIFNRLYEYEKKNGFCLKLNQVAPEWFIKIARLENCSSNITVRTRKDYIAYRKERDKRQEAGVAERQASNYDNEFGIPTNKILVDTASKGRVAFKPTIDLRKNINDELDMIINDLDNLRSRVYQMKDDINKVLDNLVK